MKNKIDWNFWLKRKSILEIEMALLTLGLNPENFEIDFFMDCHYLVNRDDLQTLLEDYDKRMIFIRENRFTPYQYMADDVDASKFYFDSKGTIKVIKFLLWLKNENMGWDLPPELKNHIDLMGKSKNSIIDLSKDATRSESITNNVNSRINLRDRKYSEFEEEKTQFKTWGKCAEHHGISRQLYCTYKKYADDRDNPKQLTNHTFGKKPYKK